MNQMISFLQKLQLRKSLTTLFVSLLVLTSISVGQLIYPAAAHAVSTTPEAQAYHSDRGNRMNRDAEPAQAEGGFAESIQEGAETIKEKLNLDEPLPQGTKLFFKQIKGEDVEVAEPKPGGKGEEPKNE